MKSFTFGRLGVWSVATIATAAIFVGCASGDGDDNNSDNSGSGGGTASGGSDNGSGGGTASGGGSNGPTSVCDGNSFAPENDVISDMEGEDAAATAGWDIYASSPDVDKEPDAVLTAPASGSFDDPPALVEGAPGAMGAGGAGSGASQGIHFAGTGFITYGAGMNFNLEGCKDVSEYTGVRFWLKGSASRPDDQELPPTTTDGVVNFRVITSGAHAQIMVDGKNVGGDCIVDSGKCFLPPQVNVPLTSDWEQHEIKFSDLKVPAGANPGSAINDAMNNVMLLGFHSENGDFDIYVDDIEFY